jgi:hypothetical protein
MRSNQGTLPAGFWLACLALFVMGFAFASGSQAIVNHTITKEIVVPQSAIQFTDQERIDFFVNELLTSNQASCFKKVLTKESHFNAFAKNPTSSASGVAQLLSSTYRNLGFKTNVRDAIAQTVASLAYISERYGSAGPCGAWKHEVKYNWY